MRSRVARAMIAAVLGLCASAAFAHHSFAMFDQAKQVTVVGTVTEKQGPAVKRVFDQMAEPKFVIAFGVCASTGGFYQNYSTMPGVDQVIPVDVYIPGCPPRPEQVLDAIILLMDRIQAGRGHSQLRDKHEQIIAARAAGDDGQG